MAKIQINLVARIASDKDSFKILIQLAEKLIKKKITDFEILFIGAVSVESILQDIKSFAKDLNVENKIRFTEKSIPVASLDDEIKNGYFFNFTVGLFLGYSAIDAIGLNLKNIFYNADNRLVEGKNKLSNFCNNVDEVVEIFRSIDINKENVDKELYLNNEKMRKSFYLTNTEKKKLMSFLIPIK